MQNGIRAYLGEHYHQAIIELYGGKQESFDRTVGIFLNIRNSALKNMYNIFTESEIKGILYAFQTTTFSVSSISPTVVLKAQMEDAIFLKKNNITFLYNKEVLFSKIDMLSDYDAIFFLEEINRFWNNKSSYTIEDKDRTELFLETFCG